METARFESKNPTCGQKTNVYVVTAFGKTIDTVCEVFASKDDAIEFIQREWNDFDGIERETIVEGRIWVTDDPIHQKVEWEIHERNLFDFPSLFPHYRIV